MANYTGPVCRLCRREGEKLFLKGERCMSDKCSIGRKNYAPGQHGQGKGKKKPSEYGVQLREKQKLRRIYGLMERQFENLFELADSKKGITGENLLQLLESRMDNVAYRLGFGASRKEARQLVRHGHFTVNSKKVNIPSALLRPGDEIRLKESSLDSPRIKALLEENEGKNIPDWLELDVNSQAGRIKSLPLREQIDIPIQEHLIVELYSR